MYMGNKNIDFVGLDELHPEDKETVRSIILTKYPFIEREIKRINSLKLHVKSYKEGGNKRYSMNLLIDSPGGVITADQESSSAEWDPIASTYLLIDKVREQIKHKFRLKSI